MGGHTLRRLPMINAPLQGSWWMTLSETPPAGFRNSLHLSRTQPPIYFKQKQWKLPSPPQTSHLQDETE